MVISSMNKTAQAFFVNGYVLEAYILDCVFLVVATDDRRICTNAIIVDMTECDIFDSSSRCFVVFGIEKNVQIEQTAFLEVVNPNMIKSYMAHDILVSAIDGHAPLIIAVVLIMFQYIDITDMYILKNFSLC
mgnify:FL=1